MPADPEVLNALRLALERDPKAIGVRLHLAKLLLESGAESAALEHYLTAISDQPDNVEALQGAAQAADAVGDSSRAASFRRLAEGLSKQSGGGKQIKAGPGQLSGEHASDTDLPSAQRFLDAEVAGITLADVGGMEDVKHRLYVSLLGPLRNPEVQKAYGKSLRGGLLLFGPPGCGKTYIARATAGELGAHFIGVGLADVLDMWLGQSEHNVHDLFQEARRNAPCVVFLDEVDAIGQKRTHLRHQAGMRGVVNQLLFEMDGIQSSNEGVYVLGATNHPWDVDSALLRPGRFDRMILVLPPDQPARAAILGHQALSRPFDQIDFDSLAARTDLFSGADLAHLCESATEIALEESLATGSVRKVGRSDFEAALKAIKPSTRAWFETARNFALFSNDAGTYDELLAYMRRNRLL
jgi:SpoVK/Ycf46/Vps4 family AAA+-type ATPase